MGLEANHRENANPFAPLQAELLAAKQENAKLKEKVKADRVAAVKAFFAYVLTCAAVCTLGFAGIKFSTTMNMGTAARTAAEAQASHFFTLQTTTLINPPYCTDSVVGLCNVGQYLCSGTATNGRRLFHICCDDDPAEYNDGCHWLRGQGSVEDAREASEVPKTN